MEIITLCKHESEIFNRICFSCIFEFQPPSSRPFPSTSPLAASSQTIQVCGEVLRDAPLFCPAWANDYGTSNQVVDLRIFEILWQR